MDMGDTAIKGSQTTFDTRMRNPDARCSNIYTSFLTTHHYFSQFTFPVQKLVTSETPLTFFVPVHLFRIPCLILSFPLTFFRFLCFCPPWVKQLHFLFFSPVLASFVLVSFHFTTQSLIPLVITPMPLLPRLSPFAFPTDYKFTDTSTCNSPSSVNFISLYLNLLE